MRVDAGVEIADLEAVVSERQIGVSWLGCIGAVDEVVVMLAEEGEFESWSLVEAI